MNQGKVELNHYSKDKTSQIFQYSVENNNGKTTIDQHMCILSTAGLFDPKWIAQINLDDFPPQETPEAAAHKLADWLERLAASIRIGVYPDFKEQEFTDLNLQEKL
jgi:hypothetical protein